jgi:hypothetical protein
MKDSSFPTTPALLICAAFPILFLLAPDGIPCVYAVCGDPAVGTVSNLGVNQCRGCSADDAQDENINVTNCSVSKATGQCEITASVDVRIKGQCDVLWRKFCFDQFGGQCGATEMALQGPNYPYFTNVTKTHGCTGDQELMAIWLVPSTGQLGKKCECTPLGGNQGDPVYLGSGICNVTA